MRTNAHGAVCAECGRPLAPGEGVRIGFGDDGLTMCLDHHPEPPPRSGHSGWHTTLLASLNFESTGVDPHTDRIIGYAALADVGIDLVGAVNPGISIFGAPAELHGVAPDAIKSAPSSVTVLKDLLEWVADLIWREVGLVVFNATFDLTMLRAEADRYELAQPDWDKLFIVDPYIIDWGIERGRLGSRRLSDVAEYYGVRASGMTRAAADAAVAREIAIEIGARHPGVVATTFDMLMAQQRFWAAARSMEWNRIALRKRRHLKISGDWPFASGLST